MKIDKSTALRIAKRIRKDPETQCWNWTGQLCKGYGVCGFQGKKSVRVHKLIWEHVNGPVGDGLELGHKCGNKGCVNPYHLEAVSRAANMQEAAARRVFSGERNGMSKLTNAEVSFLRLLHSQGLSARALAKGIPQLPIKPRELHYILSGKTWSHISAPEFVRKEA